MKTFESIKQPFSRLPQIESDSQILKAELQNFIKVSNTVDSFRLGDL